jgi:DGQHR domain-containing protein
VAKAVHRQLLPRPIMSMPVIAVRQPVGTFYISSVAAEQLVEITYADVRRLASERRDVERYLGIQRPVSSTRIKQIREYITSPDASFPTGVIIAVDEKCAVFNARTNTLALYAYEPTADERAEGVEPIPVGKIGKVLDGQHRLAGFLDEDENWNFDFEGDTPFDLNVVIFVGADLSEQANIFATVNLAQTKVSRSLVYDLQDLAKSRSPFRTCHLIAVALDDYDGGPLHHRIKRLGVRTPGRTGETITQASFVEALVKFISLTPMADRNALLDGKRLRKVGPEELKRTPFRNMFIEERDLEIGEIVNNYFSAVRDKWPASWDAVQVQGNLLPKTNAFNALMRYLREDVYVDACEGNYGYIPSVEEFLGYFDHVRLRDRDFTTRNFVPGSGGQAMFYRVLTGDIAASELFEE